MEYDKAGVKPADMVILRNQAGKLLVYGKDYTISYRDNKAVADKTAVKAPTIIIKGKGNYTDTREIPFTITKASLNSEKIAVTLKETAYNAGKASSYQYKPSVKVADGKKTLSVNKDYTVRYENNTQEAYEAYYINGTVSGEEFRPRVIITACESGNYKSDESIILPLPIYRNKLAANKLYVVVAEANYTGKQVAPDIIVYYSSDTKAVAAVKKQGLKDEAAICAQGLVKLQESRDYKVTYGANIVAGNNKGTVKIIGNSPEYGGSVTIKFKISSKKIVW